MEQKLNGTYNEASLITVQSLHGVIDPFIDFILLFSNYLVWNPKLFHVCSKGTADSSGSNFKKMPASLSNTNVPPIRGRFT
jgi:hypothetical protein